MQRTPRRLFIVGLILALAGPFAGFLMTILGMIGAFRSLKEQGVATPQELSGHIGAALMATMGGIVVSVLGVILMAAALVVHFAARKSIPPPPRA